MVICEMLLKPSPFLNPMLVDSADGVNEADEGIERRKGMGWGLKKGTSAPEERER